MAKQLYIESSTQRALRIAVSAAFLESYRSSHPDDEIELWDLWREPLMEFDQDALDAKYAVIHQEQQSPGQKAA
ncbi:MAG: NAD(P)H-dependent oxidoreductase [Prolixibacteraceae bacterium]|nr:NAD(P)H-dependent oxidoreductase [Burkholderiales bacterium]